MLFRRIPHMTTYCLNFKLGIPKLSIIVSGFLIFHPKTKKKIQPYTACLLSLAFL